MGAASVARFAGLALLWGSNFLFIKVSLEGMSPMQIVASRMALGALVLVVALPFYRMRLPRGWAVWGHLAVAAAVGNLVPYGLFAWAEQHVASNVAGAIIATTPLFTLGLALGLRLERLTVRRVTGLLVGFAGVMVLLSPWEAAGTSVAGQVASLGASFGYAVLFVYAARFLSGRGLPPLAVAAGQLCAGTALLAVTAPAIVTTSVALTARVAWSAFLLGAFGTGVAYLLNYRLLTDEGATTTSLVVYLLPIVAVVLGVLLLDEPLTPHLAAGSAMILAGVAISSAARPQAPMRSAMRRRWSEDVPSNAAPDRARRK
jgi:drug/metabolite transporter (DMT)-like permease